VKLHKPSTTCPNPRCGKEFDEPLLLRNLSKSPVERYYVCPHCIIKLNNVPSDDQRESSFVRVEAPLVPTGPKEPGSSSCTHHVGFLKTLPKGDSIPEDCLTCPELLRCMFKK